MPFEEQVCVFYAVLNNFFEKIAVVDIKKTENELVEYLEKFHEEDILKPIRESGQFDEAVEAKLKGATQISGKMTRAGGVIPAEAGIQCFN